MTGELREATKKSFVEACAKFWSYFRMCEDIDFCPEDNPHEELEDLKKQYQTKEEIAEFDRVYDGLTTYADRVKKLEDMVLYNQVVDNADPIYAEILRCAKLIYFDIEEYGFTESDLKMILSPMEMSRLDQKTFESLIYNMGMIKGEIDFEKEMNTELAGEQVYPETEKVEAITDEDEIRLYLQV